jgi:hypothetical protein
MAVFGLPFANTRYREHLDHREERHILTHRVCERTEDEQAPNHLGMIGGP